MHILELKNIGKIYASKRAIAVGIRGVNASFDLGEIVAITGQSGSGKTSLLNVISGIDSYEEGELLIANETTSHYANEDWEEYREKYISMIFQDYNIIECFTVLQNVELALMNMENSSERRKKALELIERVGLLKHINHKGSHLSGGQKQRTAIARALAKDSPIILADEPTGNLDEGTSKEIIQLLKEVSENKLLIIVTHNFEQVEKYATREIHIVDGKIESDRKIRKSIEVNCTEELKQEKDSESQKKNHILSKSISLGLNVFKAKPKLSFFLCFILTLANISVFLFTGVFGKEIKYNIVGDNHLFRETDGRVVIVKRDGTVISTKEVESLAAEYGAEGYIHCDILFDAVNIHEWRMFMDDPNSYIELYNQAQLPLWIDRCDDLGELDIGRYPESVSECILYVPYALSDYFGTDSLKISSIVENKIEYEIVGIKYFVDNNQIGRMMLTEEGYRINSAMAYIGSYIGGKLEVKLSGGQSYTNENSVYVTYSFDVEPENVYIKLNSASEYICESDQQPDCRVVLVKYEKKEESTEAVISQSEHFYTVPKENIYYDASVSKRTTAIVLNPYTLLHLFEEYIDKNYTQCSIFFYSKEEMKNAIEKINGMDYLAIPSNTEYINDDGMFSEYLISGIWMGVVWIIAVFFLMIFVSLCTKRVLEVFKGDISIMRSIGIKVEVIKGAVYIRMLVSMIPAVLCTFIVAFVLYRNAFTNRLIMYLYPIHYMIIFIGILIITMGVARKQIRSLFDITVQKALKGDE